MSVSGPVAPLISEACCDAFANSACDSQDQISEVFDVPSAKMCQELCRDDTECQYWTHLDMLCFLYRKCDATHSCEQCSSGPEYPDIEVCEGEEPPKQGHVTLLLGGHTGGGGSEFSPTLELITAERTCTPNIPFLPVGRLGAAATVLGSKIFYCGGFNNKMHEHYHSDCNSYLMTKESNAWEEEDSMNYPRDLFTLTTINDRMYAVGGAGSSPDYHNSVESYSLDDGWVMEDTMVMKEHRYSHCAAALEAELFIIGGNIGSGSDSVQSFSVGSGDSWNTKKSMSITRYGQWSCMYSC